MFATLGGSLPEPPLTPEGDIARGDAPFGEPPPVEALVRAAVAAQEGSGLEPVTDGGLRHREPFEAVAGALDGIELRDGAPPLVRRLPAWRSPILVRGWRTTTAYTDHAVKQPLPGPYSLGRHVAPGRLGRERVTLALAEALREEIVSLAEAGCPLVEVVEDAAVLIGEDPAERRLFQDAQRRLLAGVEGTHLSLAIRGGSADGAGAATILDAPYASYLFDLCAGPDNWRLIVQVPADRGIIVGAADAGSAKRDTLEILAFAVGYAASTAGRGHARVGLATSGDLTEQPWSVAAAKIRSIGDAAAAYAGPPGTLARAMDPRAVDIRSAALGRLAPDPRDRARRP